MNKNAKRWVKALRSGRYKQGTNNLCSIEKGKKLFCALGVACELYQKSIGDLKVVDKKNGLRSYSSHTSHLPKKVKDWLGLQNNIGEYEGHCSMTFSLSGNNDGYEQDFNEIADIIESEPKGLFKDE